MNPPSSKSFTFKTRKSSMNPAMPQDAGADAAVDPVGVDAHGDDDFLAHGGELGSLIRQHHWAATSLGPPAAWPTALRVTVATMLASRQPMYIAWGPSLISLYNDAYVPFCGAKHPNSLGMPFVELWSEVWEQLRPVVQATLAGEAQWIEDAPMALAGRSRPMSWFTFGWTPLRDDAGIVQGFLGVATETTDKMLALRQLAREHENLAQLFEQAPTFMALLQGAEHRFEFINPAYLRLVGHRPVLGKTVIEAFPEAVAQGYLDLLDQVYASGVAFSAASARLEIQMEDGGPRVERYLDFVYQPIRDASDRVTGIFVQGVDVTERAVSEHALHRTQEQLRALNSDLERQVVERSHERTQFWQHTSDLLGVLNAQGYFERSNAAWQTVLGWSEEEVQATLIFDLLHPDDRSRTCEGLERLKRGLPVLNFVNRYRCKDGSYRWLSWVGVPDEGKYYCSGRDISEQREAQILLNETQEALRQSQKMEAVGQLTGGIAHDFNNLLASIGASLQVLDARLRKGKNEGASRYISMGQESVHRAAALTQRLLAFSRRQTLAPQAVALDGLVAGMQELIERTAGPDVAVQVMAPASLWLTTIDPSQLENALLNLCINARDAMQPDGGRLVIETANETLDEAAALRLELPPGDYVALSVQDSGSGMSVEVIARAFDPFFTTKPLGQGTGLGLSMVYGFVRQSGGQVQIESELGKGTSMRLWLPRHEGAPSESPGSQHHPRRDDVAAAAGETVLLIEDEASIRHLVTEVLEEAGYRVIGAADGNEGLRVLQSSQRIELLVSDVGLPGGLNGRQVADAGRVLRPSLKVLFITGYMAGAASIDPLPAGMRVMTKPFEVMELAQRVREMTGW